MTYSPEVFELLHDIRATLDAMAAERRDDKLRRLQPTASERAIAERCAVIADRNAEHDPDREVGAEIRAEFGID